MRVIVAVLAAAALLAAQGLKVRPQVLDEPYLLGPEDEISIHVDEIEQLAGKRFRIDPNGSLDLPVAGRIEAAGLAIPELSRQVALRLRRILKNPQVTIDLTESRGHPVFVLGSVTQPGVQQLKGPRRLLEALVMAGGMRSDAGGTAHITRESKWGQLPLPGARKDASGNFSVADLNLEDLTKGRAPETNIYLRPNDTIAVDRAEIVYVIGEVKKAGGFPLEARETLTVLQVLALAGGMSPSASAKNARILRKDPEKSERQEIAVNLKKIMDSTAPDVPMRPDDVLLVPNNLPRSVALRSAEAAIQIGTGLVIWRR